MKFSVSIESLHLEENRRMQLSFILESTKNLLPNVRIATDLAKIINTCSKQNEKIALQKFVVTLAFPQYGELHKSKIILNFGFFEGYYSLKFCLLSRKLCYKLPYKFI